jgi:transposase
VPDPLIYTDTYPAYDVVSGSITIGLITQTPTRANATITSMGSRTSGARLSAPLSRYNGIPKANFHLFLKETEFHINYGTPSQQLRSLKCLAKISS